MSKLVFDTLEHARRLKAAGIPNEQAEAHAELMGQAFSYYIGELVTRDYLDATLNARFAEQEARIDARVQALETQLEARMDRGFAEIKSQLRLHNWVLALLAAAILLPKLSALARL